MALSPPPARYDVSDGSLLKRLGRGDPGTLDRIRGRYALTVYAIAYGVLMDTSRSAAVVEQTFAECARVAGESFREGQSLYAQLSGTARRLSREFTGVPEEESPGTEVPLATRVVRQRWIAARPEGASA